MAHAATRNSPRKESPARASHVLRSSPRLAFDPRKLKTPLALWVRSDLGATMNGSTVSKWVDMSGNDRDLSQSTAADQPSLNSAGVGGRPDLSFDGSSDVLPGSSFYGMLSAADEWSIAVVCAGWSWGATIGATWGTAHGRAVLGAPNNSGSYFSLVIGNSSQGPTSGFYPSGASAPAIATPPSAGSQGEDLIWLAINDGDLVTRINGKKGTSVTSGDVNSLATTLAVGHGTSQTTFWDGSISEVLIFDGTLGASEVSALESYLSDRYKIGAD